MAVMLGFEAVNGALGMREAIDLLEQASAHETAHPRAMACAYNDGGSADVGRKFDAQGCHRRR